MAKSGAGNYVDKEQVRHLFAIIHEHFYRLKVLLSMAQTSRQPSDKLSK